MEMLEASPWWVLALAIVVGYFVVSKLVDFFVKGSSWDSSKGEISSSEQEDLERKFSRTDEPPR